MKPKLLDLSYNRLTKNFHISCNTVNGEVEATIPLFSAEGQTISSHIFKMTVDHQCTISSIALDRELYNLYSPSGSYFITTAEKAFDCDAIAITAYKWNRDKADGRLIRFFKDLAERR